MLEPLPALLVLCGYVGAAIGGCGVHAVAQGRLTPCARGRGAIRCGLDAALAVVARRWCSRPAWTAGHGAASERGCSPPRLTAPLVLRRRAPLAAFGAIALVAFVQWLASIPSSADAALLVAIYSVAAYEPRRWGPWLALAVLELGVLLAALSFGADEPLVPAILTLSAFVVAAVAWASTCARGASTSRR